MRTRQRQSPSTTTVTTSFRLEKDLRAWGEKEAARHGMTFSYMMVLLLRGLRAGAYALPKLQTVYSKPRSRVEEPSAPEAPEAA